MLMSKNVYAAESAFEKTPVGSVIVKSIPSSKMLLTVGEGNYFDNRNDLFRRLFNYINTNKVAMTVPVEVEIENASMKFYVGSKDKLKALQDEGSVQVIDLPPREVVSIGIRGAYTRKHFEEAKSKLETWLKENRQYQQTAEAYAVYWDAPFMPWFLKRAEVHIPIGGIGEK